MRVPFCNKIKEQNETIFAELFEPLHANYSRSAYSGAIFLTDLLHIDEYVSVKCSVIGQLPALFFGNPIVCVT